MTGRRSSRRHGYVVIDKPGGWTSHDVVARARRVLGERRVGHAGTLDPAAVGVLPLAVGDATRTVEYLSAAGKSYLAEVTLGIETDSYDSDGVLVAIRDASGVTRTLIEDRLREFQGTIGQLPPMHSAIRVDGKRLYDQARAGNTVERSTRTVTIHRLELLEWDPPTITLLIDCSKGTYVRSLAHDLGQALGVGAMLANLVRLRTGPFTLCDAMTLTELERVVDVEPWSSIAYHPDVPLMDRPAAVLDAETALRWRQGSSVTFSTLSDAGLHRVYDEDGLWLGIGDGDPETRRLRPTKVINAE